MKKRWKFLIRQSEEQPDGSGGYSINWVNRGYIWGEFIKESGLGGKFDGENRQYLHSKIAFDTYENINFNIGWRLKCGAMNFDILSIDHLGASKIVVSVRREIVNEL